MKYNTKTVNSMIYKLGEGQYIPKWKHGYINAHYKFPMYHKKCNKTYLTCWNYFQSGYRCPYCYGNNKMTKVQLAKKIYKLGKGQYILKLRSKYNNAKQKLPIKHLKCGHIIYMSWNKFQQGERCKYCNAPNTLIMTPHRLAKRIKDQSSNKYILVTNKKHIKAKTPVKVLHLKCHKTFITTADRWNSGCRCPHCNASKGETHTGLYLQKHHIKYIHAYHLHCFTKHHKALHLDFYLPKYNIGIEYDGIQHERPVNHFGGIKNFQKTKIRDHMKNKYCKKEGIYLIRIHYPYKNQHETFDEKNIKCIINTLNRKLLPKIHQTKMTR